MKNTEDSNHKMWTEPGSVQEKNTMMSAIPQLSFSCQYNMKLTGQLPVHHREQGVPGGRAEDDPGPHHPRPPRHQVRQGLQEDRLGAGWREAGIRDIPSGTKITDCG